jgi:hypothetical protein
MILGTICQGTITHIHDTQRQQQCCLQVSRHLGSKSTGEAIESPVIHPRRQECVAELVRWVFSVARILRM